MTWVKLDDNMPDHPKIVGLSDYAFRLHLTALCYAARHMTDGVIDEKALRHCSAGVSRSSRMRAKNELLNATIWHKTRTGYEIHQFTEYQRSKDDRLADRAKTAERVTRWRGRRNAVTSESGNGVSNAAPDQTRPITPLPPQVGEQENGDLEPLTPRDAGTNPRARKQRTKAQRSHAAFVARTRGLYKQWLAEDGATPEGVADQIRQAYPDIADEVLA